MATKLVSREAMWDVLKACESYRDFLRAYLSLRELSFSDFARAAGCGRGFPSDVISGKRRLTGHSFYGFEKALKVPSAGRKFFRLLVALEETDIFPEFEKEKIQEGLQRLRHKPWNSPRRVLQESKEPQLKNIFRDAQTALVYTAAGRPDRGATREEILNRTALAEANLSSVLQKLTKAGLLTYEDQRYTPQDLHLFYQSVGESDFLSSIFQGACSAASERVKTAVSSQAEMFFTSTFCVDENQLPELKKALRETILKFVDESIHAEGNRIARLTTAFHL